MNNLRKLISFLMTSSSRWWLPTVLGIAILLLPFRASPKQPVERFFQVEASRFAYSPSVLRVNRGDRVTIEMVSTDVVHGISVDGYGVEATSDPGQAAQLSFVADKTGSFRFRCTVTCGAMHPFMIGKIQVGDNTLLWRAVGLAVLVVGVLIWRRL